MFLRGEEVFGEAGEVKLVNRNQVRSGLAVRQINWGVNSKNSV